MGWGGFGVPGKGGACSQPVWEEHALSKASSPEEEKVGSTKRRAVALIPAAELYVFFFPETINWRSH